MRVLYITIPFYEYIGKIQDSIKRLNIEVDVFQLQVYSRGIKSIFNKLSNGKIDSNFNLNTQKKFFKKVENIEYDYIFVLVGRGLDTKIFNDFCKKQKNAKKILYLWDDVERIENFKDIKLMFNTIISFDKKDCKKYGFQFLPLFYCGDYKYSGERKKYDISCTGSLHSDRVAIIERILRFFPREKYCWYGLILVSKLDILKKKILKSNTPIITFYKNKTLNMQQNAEILKQSKVVIDIPHESQNGLSIRTFEALAAKTKIITTNSAIENYEFYDERNICIIDRKNPIVPKEFIQEEFVETGKYDIEKYCIDNWVKTIFMHNEEV